MLITSKRSEYEIEESIRAIEEHWGELERPNRRRDFQETQENATEWLEAFQAIEAEMLAEGRPVELERVLEEADQRVPERTQSSSSHASLWVAVGGIVLALIAVQFRRRRGSKPRD